MRKIGKKKPPYESNHTKVICSHYAVFIPYYSHFKKQINWKFLVCFALKIISLTFKFSII